MAGKMKFTIGCFQDIDSATMRERLHETSYTYQVRYKCFTDETDLPDKPAGKELLCPHCGRAIRVAIRSRMSLLIIQASILLLFISTLPVSLYLFSLAVSSPKDGMWTAAILFLLFGCVFTGFISFDIEKYELENLYRIRKGEVVKAFDGKLSFKRHRIMDEGHVPLLRKAYAAFRVAYAASILIYAWGFFMIVVARESGFGFIALSLGLALAFSLPLLRAMNFLYDKHWGRTTRLK